MTSCRCGSGKPRYELLDAARIFCAYVCVDCEEERAKHFRPEIFDYDSRYARTGEEEDLG